MAKKRYINTRDQSFFGNYIYDQMVPAKHFLRLLNQMINWDRFTDRLIEIYRGGGEYGRPPFNPSQILKMCLLANFYNLSNRQVEVHVNENLPAKYFVGLGLDQKAPDHSTLTVFRKRLTKQGNLEVFEGLLAELVQAALAAGVRFGSLQVIDSVHSIANVNTAKDERRKHEGKGPHDPDAKWGAKGKHKYKDATGKEVNQVKYFFGYKAHVSMNAENHLITSLEVTSGEAYDGHHFCSLVDQDLSQDIPVNTYTADRGYDDGNNHFYLEYHHLHSAICLKDIRTKKKDANKEVWLKMIQTPAYKEGRKERYKIERKFGEAKQGHGLGRCRYIGLLGFGIQAYFTAIILNLKRIVKLLTGVGLKTGSALAG
ncbi:MAG: transposase [Chloroflexota bacterium]|nr:transposase [Chloroflexota bacterium]